MPRQDRPEIRRDEIKDTSNILKKFFNVYTKEFFEKHNNLFGDNAFELHLITAKVMGRDMNNIAKRHKMLHNRLKSLSKVRTKNKNIEIAEIMAEFMQIPVEIMWPHCNSKKQNF